MKYISTRNRNIEIDASQAIIKGISDDGGLFVPSSFPKITLKEIKKISAMRYPERAAYVMAKFLPEFSYDEILGYCHKAYGKFEEEDACPLVEIDNGLYILELWHGPTHAFKDMALSVMPFLMTASRDKRKIANDTLILVATSGDTGKAALEGFKDVDGAYIMVFYPEEGVSRMQKLQMSTQDGNNVYAAGIMGNFDDAQSAVKEIFADREIISRLKEMGYDLSSANSINWGRLVPQIAYYISAYCDLLDGEEITEGDKINFAVPCGNFGNILAAYYAKEMGLPINKLICCSNSNNVLTEFFFSGRYNINREFIKTMSPSMDILISSNLERLLFELLDRDSEKIKELMDSLKSKGIYEIDKLILAKKADCFVAGFSSEKETAHAMANFFEIYSYLLDPHTAVAMDVYNNYLINTGDMTPTVVVSTASPYKFPQDVYKAVMNSEIDDPFRAAKKLKFISAQEIPEDFIKLEKAAVRFDDVYEVEDIKEAVIANIRKRNIRNNK